MNRKRSRRILGRRAEPEDAPLQAEAEDEDAFEGDEPEAYETDAYEPDAYGPDDREPDAYGPDDREPDAYEAEAEADEPEFEEPDYLEAEQADAEPAPSLDELAALADSLLAQATELRRQNEVLLDALERLDPGAQDSDAASAQHAQVPGSEDAETVRLAVRLLAVQMSLAGHSREEIEQTLRTRFGEQPDPELLDAALGGGIPRRE